MKNNPSGRNAAISAAVHSLSIGQLHALSLLGFSASGMALLAPLLLPAGGATGGAAAKEGSGWRGHWLTGFCANLIGYASVLLPLYLIVWLARSWGYGKRGDGRTRLLPACIRLLALGSGDPETGDLREDARSGKAATGKSESAAAPHTLRWCLHLSACFLGLQATYLTWGLLQERMMTIQYGGEHFRDSQFLVFANRALGGLLALPLMLTPAAGGSGGVSAAAGRAPAFEYAYSSLSNILSSWCQYEALVHVTFPTQVLAKASKIIPVMLMGRLLSRRSYRLDEYLTSGLISAGTAMFLLSSSGGDSESASASPKLPSAGDPTSASTALSGGLLLTGYLVFDAFTSSWQSHLFIQYRITALQMMAGSSLLSCLVTVAAQLQQGSLSSALAFAGRHPLFAGHLALLSLCSTLGQLVIFHTIDRFGPVTFTIIMTVRQAFAILISCMVYQHQLSSGAWLGVVAVFGALFLRIYLAQRQHRAKS